MDALVLEDFIILKSELDGPMVDEAARSKYLAQFQLD
jgi:hypothetical protein